MSGTADQGDYGFDLQFVARPHRRDGKNQRCRRSGGERTRPTTAGSGRGTSCSCRVSSVGGRPASRTRAVASRRQDRLRRRQAAGGLNVTDAPVILDKTLPGWDSRRTGRDWLPLKQNSVQHCAYRCDTMGLRRVTAAPMFTHAPARRRSKAVPSRTSRSSSARRRVGAGSVFGIAAVRSRLLPQP